MTFPSGFINTDNLTSGTSSPALARADLLLLVQAFNQLVQSANQPNGAAVLNSLGQLGPQNIPAQQSPQGLQILSPTSGVVNIRNILRLQPRTTDQLLAIEFPARGDVSLCSDGDAGRECLAVYQGDSWRIVRLMTTIGGITALLTSSFEVTCEAD